MKNIVRITATLLSISVYCSAYWVESSVYSNAISESRSYTVFDAQLGRNTGEYYTLYELSSSYNARDIIGSDDRELDWSKSGVVKLIDGDHYLGTGFVVSAHVIATAAHCLYATHGGVDTVILFNSDGTEAMHATPIESHIPSVLFSTTDVDVWSKYDYALITVEEDLSAYAQFNLGVVLDSAITNNTVVSITGFPTEVDLNDDGIQNDNDQDPNNEIVNTVDEHAMYTASGTLYNGIEISPDLSWNPRDFRLAYNTDATDGNSGSPVYVSTLYRGNTYLTVVAIHAHSIPANSGVRITSDLLHFYLDNPNAVID